MPKPCCNKFMRGLPDDEPVFILAGRDSLAVSVVSFWIEKARASGVNESKIRRAERHLDDIIAFQEQQPERVKLPD